MAQSVGFLATINAEAIMTPGTFFTISTMLIITTGTLFCMWLGEKITDKGIGNGISMIIMIGIVSRLPGALIGEAAAKGVNKSLIFLLELVVLFLVVMAVIVLTQAVRRIPVQYAKQVGGATQLDAQRQFIPLKVNAAGVMPIIFAQSLMFVPSIAASAWDKNSDLAATIAAYFSPEHWVYNTVFALLIVIFTYFYTAISVNPNQIADDLKRSGGFVPGVKPGRDTSEFIDEILTRVTLPGAVALALIAIFPTLALLLGVTRPLSLFYGGTSLIIMVGVVLDTLNQVESYLLMRHYDGMMKSGKLREEEIELMRAAGQLLARAHGEVAALVREGATTRQLDHRAEEFIRDHGATPSFKGLYGFPHSCCLSPNSVVVHGFATDEPLQSGDIL
nr:preprotein translocase subunit SCY1, chloroplastic [Tanacetum cinerariifolium]